MDTISRVDFYQKALILLLLLLWKYGTTKKHYVPGAWSADTGAGAGKMIKAGLKTVHIKRVQMIIILVHL